MSDSNDLISNQNLQWNINIELMLSKWCDQAKCYEWMHIESWNSYNKKAKQLMIILTVLGSFSGLTNVIAGNYNVNGFQMSWVFGSIGILVGMLNVLQDKLSYQTLANDFKQYSIQWGVIRRSIEEELIIPPNSRENCATFLKFIRKSINQVYMDGSSKIPQWIKQKCYNKFKDISEFDIPDICGQIEHTVIYIEELEKKRHLIINDTRTELIPLLS